MHQAAKSLVTVLPQTDSEDNNPHDVASLIAILDIATRGLRDPGNENHSISMRNAIRYQCFKITIFVSGC